MRRGVFLSLAASALLVPSLTGAGLAAIAAGDGEAASPPKHFQTPSKRIGCVHRSSSLSMKPYLRCDIDGGLQPEPRRRCEQDWVVKSQDVV